MKLTEKLDRLLPLCDADERELIEDMISDAANYVKCVVIMESQAHNFAGREGQDYRDTVTSADRTRHIQHNALIDAVNIVNRICACHNIEPIYQGDTVRRHYGDFALELVTEIFADRK